MPAEAQRLSRPVGRRDRRLMAVLAAAGVLLAGGGAAYARLHSGHGAADDRCVVVPATGVMGGGAWRYCGPKMARSEDRGHRRRLDLHP